MRDFKCNYLIGLPRSIQDEHDRWHSSPCSSPFLLAPTNRSTIYTSPNYRTTNVKNRSITTKSLLTMLYYHRMNKSQEKLFFQEWSLTYHEKTGDGAIMLFFGLTTAGPMLEFTRFSTFQDHLWYELKDVVQGNVVNFPKGILIF